MREPMVRSKQQRHVPAVEVVQVAPVPGYYDDTISPVFNKFVAAFNKALDTRREEALADRMKRLLERTCENM